MKKICFTAITGGVDDLKEPLKPNPSWDYVCFTDDPELRSVTWNIELVNGEDPKKLSRYYKIKNHFPEYDLSVWVDATFQIKRDLDIFALTKTEGIWLNRHPMRQCAYEELEVVKSKGLDDHSFLDSRIAKYKEEGFPEQWGLWRCGIMVRPGRNSIITEMCETWWKEIEEGTWRDQAAFSYACWKTGVKPNSILKGITENFFKQSLHKCHPTEEWLYDSGEPVEKENPLIQKYDTAHLIVTKDRLLFPKWLKNYINPRVGKQRFEELVKILNGVIVRG